MSGVVLAAALASAFNLSCNLHMTLQASLNDKPHEGSFPWTLRIDLDSMRWCDDKCEETRPIVGVTNTELILISDADPRIDAYESLTINRESGRYDHHNRINESSLDEKGVCERTPFTGFPAKRF